MRKIWSIAAIAVCANVAAFAVDWPASGGTYTVPADTTVEVGADDFDDVKALGKVKFANENSVMKFTTSSYPSGLTFEGAGTVLMSERVLLSEDTTLKHSNGSSDKNLFLKFVFEKGLDSDDGTTRRSLGADPGNPFFANATISILGPVSNVSVSSIGYNARTAMIRQRGGEVVRSSSYIGQRYDSRVAFLMEGGIFTNITDTTDHSRFFSYSRYLNFRQNGGYFKVSRSWYRADGQNNESYHTIPADFVFGGNAEAVQRFFEYYGSLNITVMGNAKVSTGELYTHGDTFGKYRHILSMNGGVLTAEISTGSTNTYFAFNGGTRKTAYDENKMFGTNASKDNPAWVRIYENGGCIDNTGHNSFYLPSLKAPVGNVLQSIAISEELANKVFQLPPAVVITDSTGAGSNAVAIVDYDFDSGKVTNITIACRGENFSGVAGAVTANLQYERGVDLLSTPLECTVGVCEGGDMTFTATSDGHAVYSGWTTNTYRGLTIIDMDHTRVYDHTAVNSGPFFQVTLKDLAYWPQFASTGLVVRTGAFGRDYVNSKRPSFEKYFPDCSRIEFYGGYFFGFAVSNSVKDIVVGGETWLTRYERDVDGVYVPTFELPSDGTLTVDYGAVVTNGGHPGAEVRHIQFR